MNAQRFGTIAAVTTVLPAIGLAGLIAYKTFWWCPEGGCPLETWYDQARLITNVGGLGALVVAFSLAFQFPFVMVARLFCYKRTVENAFLKTSFPFLGWHDRLMRKWVDLLWRS
jgi:hypothetical protein